MLQSAPRRLTSIALSAFLAVCCLVSTRANADGPFMATGVKIGEVTDSTAIVWTRLTAKPEPNPADGPAVKIIYKNADDGKKSNNVADAVLPDGVTVGDLANAAPGTEGQVRVSYATNILNWKSMPWQDVDPTRDFTAQFKLTGLKSNARYEFCVESRPDDKSKYNMRFQGHFRTAPRPDDPARVVFTVTTGQAYGDQDCPEGYKSYRAMLALDPSFFVHTGDIVYYDKLAKSDALARYHWQRTYSRKTNVEFHREVSSYFIKDDHDTWQNDCWPTMAADGKGRPMGTFTFERGLDIFPEQVPMNDGPTYRTYRWGKDLQVWLPEGRDYRSSNNAEDGPGKTIWGKEQMEWFKETVKASDATFRVVISPTPIVGPDRTNKNDNHSNKGFTYEGDRLRDFIASQKNTVTACGDRHWQYVSVDPKTKVREYSCGPISDEHAGGWSNDMLEDMHVYLNVTGGFLSGTVERVGGKPTLTMRHISPDGKVLNEDVVTAE